jgi:hypothetical protein
VNIAINNHALHIYVFTPRRSGVVSPDQALARTWTAASKLGISDQVADGRQPVDLPGELPADDLWFQVVAAKTDAQARNVAIAFTAHDVAAVLIRLQVPSADPGDADPWIALLRSWRDVFDADQLTGALGAVHLFTGTCDQPATMAAASAAETVRKVLADYPQSGLELSTVLEPGIALWDMQRSWGRSIVALADHAAAATMSEWCWVRGENSDLGRLGRYLMHSAKLRFEISVFQSDRPALREQERKIDDQLKKAFALHRQFESDEDSSGELIDAQSRLGREQGDATGLLISITRLRDLRQTVEIAAHNLRAYQPAEVAIEHPTSRSPFARDIELAQWLDGRVKHEIAYHESSRDRVAETQKLTDLRLQQITAGHTRTANLLTVLQTSLLGALLAAFSVSNAFGAKFSAPTPVRAATMTVVAGAALLLPTLALRWNSRYSWPELTAVGALGAAAGWLCAIVTSSQSPLWAIALCAALGAIILAGAAYLKNGRRR